MFYSEEDLELLKGSDLYPSIPIRRKRLKNDYEIIIKLDPDFKTMFAVYDYLEA